MQECGLLELAEGPEALGVPGNVVGEGARLEVWRAVAAVGVPQQMEPGATVAVQLDAMVGEGRKALAPEVEAEIPFAAVQFGAVEFVMPDEFPVLFLGEEALGVSVEEEVLHVRIPVLRGGGWEASSCRG